MQLQPTDSSAKQVLRSLLSSDDSEFVVETIRNSFRFCAIGLVALGLQTFVGWAEGNGASKVLVWLLTGVEYAILFADVVWFLSRLVVGTYGVILRARGEMARMRVDPLQSTHDKASSTEA